MLQCPCLHCPDRHVGCHAECDKYKSFQEAGEKIKEARKYTEIEMYNNQQAKRYFRARQKRKYGSK